MASRGVDRTHSTDDEDDGESQECVLASNLGCYIVRFRLDFLRLRHT